MQKALNVFLAIGLLAGLQQTPAQDAGNWEKITDVSPDKKLGVRITCESEPDDPKNIDPGSIAAVELVALPSKKRVMELSRNYDGAPAKIFWSQDSNWFALAVSEGPRVTETSVFHREGSEFEKLAIDDCLLWNAARWPEATHTSGCIMIEESNGKWFRRSTISRHQASFTLRLGTARSGS